MGFFVIAKGFEPLTVCLEGRCSIQLSYATLLKNVGVAGFEPATSASQTRRDNRATLHPENDCKYKVIIILSKSIINKTIVNYFGDIILTSLYSICPLITLEIVDFNALMIGSFN